MKRLALLPVLTLLVACGDTPTETRMLELPDPAANFRNGPAEAGVVVRGEAGAAFTWIDPSKGWRAFVGVDILQFCSGVVDFDVVSFQDVRLAENVLHLLQGEDMRAAVWGFTEFDCERLATEDPLASGYSDLVRTDNDVLVGGGRSNAFGFMAQGTLMDRDGFPVDFSGHQRLLLSGGQTRVLSSVINLDY